MEMDRILAHRSGDDVAVAVDDIAAGDDVTGRSLDGGERVSVRARDDVLLGHKVALVDRAAGSEIVEYGVPIGEATADIRAGDHVHVHNVRSIRWRASERPLAAAAQH
jgi:(2R)-sulfolactate sulfo-lyase subunit alpha